MCRKTAIHIFRERFIIGMGGAVPLDRGIASEICWGSTEGFAETRDGCGEAIEPGCHTRIP